MFLCVVPYAIAMISIYLRSNLCLYIAVLMLVALLFCRTRYKFVSVISMALQGALGAFMLYIKIANFVQSNYIYYVSAITVLIMIFTILEMCIAPKKCSLKGEKIS
jgi:hypothetical protein